MQTQDAVDPNSHGAATAATTVAPDSPAQANPPGQDGAQPGAPTPTHANASSAKTSATTPPKAHPRLPGWEPKYWPKILDHKFEPSEPPAPEAVIPDETVRLDYEFVLHGGREEVVRVKSQLILPLALEVDNLSQTDLSFPELVDQIIVRPLVIKFRSFLRQQFEAASRAEVARESAAKPAPPPVNNGFKIPKPANGTGFVIPKPSAKPPMPKMPSYVPPRG